jgi:hypothetical protein
MKPEEREHFSKISGNFTGELTLRPIPRSEANVARLVADNGAERGIEPKIRDCLQEHSRVGFAPRVIAAVLPNAVERVMGAVIHAADDRALLRKSLAHPLRQLRIGFFVELAAADTALVRDDNEGPSHLVGPEAAKLEYSRNELKLIGPMHVCPINIDDAVPVEEERALRHGPSPYVLKTYSEI